MNKLTWAFPIQLTLMVYIVAIGALLLFEKFAIGAHVYGYVKASNETFLAAFLLDYGKPLSRSLTLSVFIFLVLIQSELKQLLSDYRLQFQARQLKFALPQIVLFVAFYYASRFAFGEEKAQFFWQVLWLLLGILLLISTFLLLVPKALCHRLLIGFRFQWGIAMLLSLSIWGFAALTQDYWKHFVGLTFSLVSSALELLHGQVISLPEEHIIGLNDFLVKVDAQCSGYEGIGLVTAFVAVFLYSFRKDFRFPNALILFPLGALLIWLFNLLRIMILILIGAHWSPEIAVWGFHTQAGWIAFILTSLAMMLVALKSPLFTKRPWHPAKAVIGNELSIPVATLIPVVVLLAMTLLTSAFSGVFDFLYPLKIAVVAASIFYVFGKLKFQTFAWRLSPVFWGVGVAVIWGMLVDIDPEVDRVYKDTLADSVSFWIHFWLILRLLGSVIVIPIAEELAFRSYLLCRLGNQPVILTGRIPFSPVALLLSSLAFGFVHDSWLAGTTAGLVYAWVRYRSEHLSDAILAHATTNFCLFIYVVSTGHWSML